MDKCSQLLSYSNQPSLGPITPIPSYHTPSPITNRPTLKMKKEKVFIYGLDDDKIDTKTMDNTTMDTTLSSCEPIQDTTIYPTRDPNTNIPYKPNIDPPPSPQILPQQPK